MGRKKLGEALLDRKRISPSDLKQALEEQQRRYMLLGELLLERRLVSKEALVSALEEVSRFHYVDSRFATVETALLELIPRTTASFYCALPLAREGRNTVVMVMAEPQNLRIIDELRFLTGMAISPRLGFRAEINEAIEHCYSRADPERAEATKLPFIEQVDTSDMQFYAASASQRHRAALDEFEAELRNEKTPAVRLVSALLAAAAAKKASDIHIEPRALGTVARMRVDGVLRELTHIPAELTASLVSRVKILADMDIAERRTPQDGRFLVQIGSKELDLRVSTLPTRDGEKVVLRLLDPSSVLLRFEDLGFSAPNARTLGGLLEKPQGMLLVTGPTGSGKTTTLYAALNQLRSPSVNVITIEDPIEYRLQDINQVQINPKAGLTFATCVRAMLRQDPNIIMVGEIRDTETAEIALQAAQTGHLVLSTLHTNDSVSAVTRLIDLSIPGFLISSSVTGILGQRLVRKLCSCRDQAPLSSEYRSRLRAVGVEDFDDRMFIQIGCGDCDNTGYKGRVGIFELLVIDDRIRSELRSGVTPEHEIRAVATGTGMKLMHEDALDKVRAGLTTLDEVLRVVPFEHAIATRCGACGQALSPGFLFCPYCGVSTRQRTAGGRAEAIGPLSATEVCVDEHLA